VVQDKGSYLSRLAESRLPAHIPDLTAVDIQDDLLTKVVKAGFRTNLIVPMLKDNEVIGIIGLARKQAQPFTDEQIALCKDFAAQATIALELCGGPPREARAQEYPWCVGSGDGLVDCSYSTYEQCQATASGIGGCFQNPRASRSDQATGSPSSLRPPRTATRRVTR
jgi:hypothetical protein